MNSPENGAAPGANPAPQGVGNCNYADYNTLGDRQEKIINRVLSDPPFPEGGRHDDILQPDSTIVRKWHCPRHCD